MGKIFYIMGKSASGKDRIYSSLIKKSELALKRLVLYTTRPIRSGEENGREYFFVTDSEFFEMEKKGCIIEKREYLTVEGIWRYFTADDGQMNLQESDYLGIGTLESYIKLKGHFGEERVCPVYVEVEDGERLLRAIGREKMQEKPKYAELCRRFLADQEDFSEENIQKAGIEKSFENDELNNCVEEIVNYIKYMKQK